MTSAAGAARGGRFRRRSEQRSEMLAGYALVAIPVILFIVLNIGAIVFALFISFFEWQFRGGAGESLGFQNYETLLTDRTFHKAIYNTATYTLWVVPLQMAIGLLLAVIVNAKIRGQTFFRAAFYFPAIASSAAITVLFIFIMQPAGLFNGIREALGLNPLFQALGFGPDHGWLTSAETALGSIMALNIWTTSGTMMLFYLASLQTVSREVYEASRIDGANAWQTFWRITFPLLKPGHYFVATVSVIGALQVFDQGYISGGSDGNPNFSLMTLVLYLYNAAFKQFNLDYAAAVGVVLFLIIFGATLVQRRLFGSAPAW
ncbi:MAG: sugar ABC transporter permease [Chloroflexota bacterium]|nr:sugar ABC transporter permease [Chloroflexota bacterium]